ncbi:RNA polymerase sigma factor [Gulosibacter molinativorax]|uniref:RNA polymerase subunit sigma n=1 Tax=Gulosibacter molinativorax TaxID=256821 RepID=A0ABT7C6M2_9MICO|nr:sigma-70 family RNA polymerase sigma factor [Gulosibacter molinativorax]MDJ1370841.1 RNA polymerase subunit sigma [Gulosibacter molinativorax]QUY62178.1 ECF-family sigma factor W [Gulosibacter molinativorax]
MAPFADERDLLARAKSGDRRAFDALLQPYRDRLWATCLRTTEHRADAEDALQNALIAIWQNLPKFRGEASIGTWAFRIATNAALAVIRKRREITVGDDEQSQSVFEPDEPGNDFASDHEMRDTVQLALAKLGEDFRVALVLREYGDYTYEQIAEYQKVPVQTVRSRLNRARKQFKEAVLELQQAGA